MGTKNDSLVDEWLDDDNLMLLEAWARDGYTHTMVAERIGISPSTLTTWKNKYPEIKNALKKGNEIIDYKVENALLKSALGFTTKEIKVTVGRQVKNGQTFEITKETTIKEVAPNVTACLAWLNNRMPDKWKRNRDKEINISDEDSNLSITIVREGKHDQDESINKEIRLESNNHKKEASKKEVDKDYWPDDWEDE